MRVLVLVEEYPNNEGCISLMYVHTRNLYYSQNGIDVDVLNFRAKKSYEYDGLQVITENDYKEKTVKYDLLVLHAANVKHHYTFLKKYGNDFDKFLFFYHGHEVLRINEVYSKPYPYVQRNKIKEFGQDIYDSFKLAVWRRYLPQIRNKSYFIFVSKWMRNEFLKWTKLPKEILKGRSSITYNCIGENFEKEAYDDQKEKKYDFVTIRSFLDGSKYSIDIINRLAYKTPECAFLVVGKGEFFSHYKKAPNIEWKNQTMSHEEIVDALQDSRFALMPTRTDAQGLMMCEMAAFGIPVITSDIPVCHEVFDDFANAYYIDNNDKSLTLSKFRDMKSLCRKDVRYYKCNTINKELDTINRILKHK